MTFRRLWLLTLLFALLGACAPAPASTSTPTPAPPPIATLTPSPLPPTPETPLPTIPPTPVAAIARVMIITFDGLRPDAIEAADMSNLKALMQNGAYTLSAQTIMPSTTLPAHASMVVGTCPAKHIVRWNEYVPYNGYALGTDIFDIAHAAGYRTVIVAGKEKLSQLTEPASLDFFGFIDTTDRIKDITTLENMAIEQLRLGFGLMLMHFPDGDLAGHEFGWMSDQQLRAYKRDDDNLGLFIEVMKSREIFDDTLFIITSDHGGHGTSHGTDFPEDMTIPWIISGPRVVPGILQTPVYIMDTAPTIALALGLPLQADWDGVPVYEAFGIPYNGPPKTGCPGLTP
ncbi:MAG TPA: alkaline phosphatase family protein [Anaerolineales bacterium]|nr:alkaline phosphatase family protein [Anaerolineales bacterium]